MRSRYALERGEPKRIEIRWGGRQPRVTVLFDEATVASFDQSSLGFGAGVALPDGTKLFLERVPRRWWSIGMRDELLVERQGAPVPGSDGDPRTIARRAGRLVILFGLLMAVGGISFSITRGGSPLLTLLALEGTVLVALGIAAAVGLRFPIGAAAFVLVAEPVLAFAMGADLKPGGLLIRALLVAHLLRSWRRMAAPARPSPGPEPSA
jgi:hypothetical protein